MGSLISGYERLRRSGEIKPDQAQWSVVQRLDELAEALEKLPKPGGLLGWPQKPKPLQGIYIHGKAGRGKTLLMDMFFAEVNICSKRRVHFHAFMQDVHGQLHKARRHQTRDAIQPVAKALAAEARLLCLDEMQIADIADAMIVGRLFGWLLQSGTVIVTTSNLPPEGLYRDGLNRQLFLPFIRLMREKFGVISLESPTDYRLGRVKANETFMTPIGPETDAKLNDLWRRLTDAEDGKSIELDVLGRKLRVPQTAHGCARFTFTELCEKPLGPADYLALAQNFDSVFLEHIPALGADRLNETKRFVVLIDTLYDARTKLVATSAKTPEKIYSSGNHSFEFDRTVSRLKEMQSASWWGKKIVET